MNVARVLATGSLVVLAGLLAWLGPAWCLAVAPPVAFPVAGVLAVSGLVTHLASAGRHFAWALFLAGALGALRLALPPGAGVTAVAWCGAALLAGIAGLHLAWAGGLRWGAATAVPEVGGRRSFEPGPATTLLVAGGLLAAAALLLALGGAWPLPAWGRGAGAAAALVFGARAVGDLRTVGLFKRIQGTAFARWDSLLFTPICVALTAAFTWVL